MLKHYLIFAWLVLFCLGCAGEPPAPPPPAPPTLLSLELNSKQNVNPDVSGKGAPVLLRIYELKDQTNFNGADFFALFDKEKAVLGGDLLRKQEFLLKPGETKTLQIEPGAETRYIGFFAAFRQLDNAQWRVIAPLALHQTNTLLLKLDTNQLAVTVQPNP
jgi:type VI secretion system protein VasD